LSALPAAQRRSLPSRTPHFEKQATSLHSHYRNTQAINSSKVVPGFINATSTEIDARLVAAVASMEGRYVTQAQAAKAEIERPCHRRALYMSVSLLLTTTFHN